MEAELPNVEKARQRIIRALEIVRAHAEPGDLGLAVLDEKVKSAKDAKELTDLLNSRIAQLGNSAHDVSQVADVEEAIWKWVYEEAYAFTARLGRQTLAKRRMFDSMDNTACWVLEPGQKYLNALLDAIGRADLRKIIRID